MSFKRSNLKQRNETSKIFKGLRKIDFSPINKFYKIILILILANTIFSVNVYAQDKLGSNASLDADKNETIKLQLPAAQRLVNLFSGEVFQKNTVFEIPVRKNHTYLFERH